MHKLHNRKYESDLNDKMFEDAIQTDTPEDLSDTAIADTPVTPEIHKKFFDSLERRVLFIMAAICTIALIVGIVLIFNSNAVVKAVGEFLTYTNIVLVAFLVLFSFTNS
jgi:hypothetical protein